MDTYLQYTLDLAVRGLLTELPAQLVTTAVAAAATTGIRARKKRRAARLTESKAEE